MNRILGFALLVAFLMCVTVRGDAQVVSGLQEGDPQNRRDRQKTFRLHPQAEPQPALKYRLLPKFNDLRSGNAAVYYGKVSAEEINFFGDYELHKQIADLLHAPLDEVRESKVAANAAPENIYHQLRLAALCNSCDWQLPIYTERFYEILLPELQQTRVFARLLALRARYQIAHGKFEDAIETFQTGYAIARHNATGPTYIHTLVAIAIQTMMDEQLEVFIQQPNAPNLYWALAALPDPLVDSRGGAEAEQNFIELSFPQLKNLDEEPTDQYTAEFWRVRLVELVGMLTLMSDGDWDDREDKVAANAAAMVLAMRGYPIARRRLIERGLDEAVVDQMSPSQVVVIEGVREFHQLNQNVLKWLYLPYYHSADGIHIAEDLLDETRDDTVLGLAHVLTPATQQIGAAVARARRQTAALQLIEAIRIYAEQNDGRLPNNLQDLTSAPAPQDPVNGQPFFYARDQYQQGSIRGPRLPAGPLDIKLEIVDE